MIVLIPVSKFRVRYEIAKGLPYSNLERLVLASVEAGVTTVTDLEREFCIHPRLLVQSLVTLIHAGWIALGGSSSQQFVLTAEGRKALSQNQLPSSFEVSKRYTHVLLERTSGIVIPEGEAQYVTRKALEKEGLWRERVQLPEAVFDNSIHEGQVEHLLPKGRDERLHWVGPVEMVSKGANFIPVSVDLESGVTLNFPLRCSELLRPWVLDRAREELERRDEREEKGVLTWDELVKRMKVGMGDGVHVGELRTSVRSPDSLREWDVLSSPDALLLSDIARRELLVEALSTAVSAVLITTKKVSRAGVEWLRPALMESIRRGVDVDILWREDADWDVLGEIAEETRTRSSNGRLRYNVKPSSCAANLVIWDRGEGEFLSAVGSSDWLQRPAADGAWTTMAFRITDRKVVSCLARSAGAIWGETESEQLACPPDKWRRIAASMEEHLDVGGGAMPQSREPVVRLGMVLDHEHSAVFRRLICGARERLFVAVPELLVDCVEELMAQVNVSEHIGLDFRMLYGGSVLDDDALRELVEHTGVPKESFVHIPSLLTNVMVSDLAVYIGSYALLSEAADGGRHVGVVLEGLEVSDMVSEFLMVNESPEVG